MSNIPNEIIELFKVVPLEDKKRILKELGEIVKVEEAKPKASALEKLWKESVMYNISKLSRYSYIDDQIEIEIIWNDIEEYIKSRKITDESWATRERILKEIIENDYYDDYGVADSMMDLMDALCLSDDEYLLCADIIFRNGSMYMKKRGAQIYKEYGKPEKYYEFLEETLDKYHAKPYIELFEYYKDNDPIKAEQIAERSYKDNIGDMTALAIYLLQKAKDRGDEERFETLIRSAKRRRTVDFNIVRMTFGLEKNVKDRK